MTKRRMRCTWCGELAHMVELQVRRDAANHLHWFHARCWLEHCQFIGELSPTRSGCLRDIRAEAERDEALERAEQAEAERDEARASDKESLEMYRQARERAERAVAERDHLREALRQTLKRCRQLSLRALGVGGK